MEPLLHSILTAQDDSRARSHPSDSSRNNNHTRSQACPSLEVPAPAAKEDEEMDGLFESALVLIHALITTDSATAVAMLMHTLECLVTGTSPVNNCYNNACAKYNIYGIF